MEAMSTTIEDLDLKRYGRLLARAVPKVIKTEEENERALAVAHNEIGAARDGRIPAGTTWAGPKRSLARRGIQEPGVGDPCRKTCHDEGAGKETRRVFSCRRGSVYLSRRRLSGAMRVPPPPPPRSVAPFAAFLANGVRVLAMV